MGDYSIEHETLVNLGDAVRHVVETGAQMTPVEMAEALNNYEPPKPSGGGVEKKQINFIDYDGSIMYSYTAEEFAQLTSLPANPEHDGLTSQGWNWTKAQITTQLTSAPGGDVWVGQMYVTTSGDTEIDITLQPGRISPYLGIAVNGSVTVDWGDESATSTVTGTSLTTQIRTNHTYPAAGDYTITIHVDSGSFAFSGNVTYTLLSKNVSSINDNRIYSNCIKKVRLGKDVSIKDNAFYYCGRLESITIPNYITSIGSSAFCYCYLLASATISNSTTEINSSAFSYCYSLGNVAIPCSVTSTGGILSYCYSLVSATIPYSLTSLSGSMFSECQTLASIIIPDGVTNIGSYFVRNCYPLASLTIPGSVTTISNNAFYSSYGMAEYHFKSTTPPELGGTGVFNNIPSDCKIYVPADSLDTYKAASRWSNYAAYIYGE